MKGRSTKHKILFFSSEREKNAREKREECKREERRMQERREKNAREKGEEGKGNLHLMPTSQIMTIGLEFCE